VESAEKVFSGAIIHPVVLLGVAGLFETKTRKVEKAQTAVKLKKLAKNIKKITVRGWPASRRWL